MCLLMFERPPASLAYHNEIPVLWMPYFSGPYRIGLAFRAGRADERLDIAGVAHLVEHLILPSRGSELARTSGMVNSTLMLLSYATETPEECLSFVRSVTERIAQLPRERFEVEKRILRAEGDSDGHPLNRALALRFGAQQHGLMGFPQLGLSWLELAETQEWTFLHLNKTRVAVWMNWEPSVQLELPFPAGTESPAITPQQLPHLTFPAIATGPDNFLAFQFVRPHSQVSTVALELLRQKLLNALRVKHGLGYQVGWSEETQTGPLSISTLWSDPRTENAAQAVEIGLRVLDEMAEHGPTREEIADLIQKREIGLTGVEAIPGRLTRYAIAELDSARPFDEQALLQEGLKLQPEQVAEAVRQMLPTTLMLAPRGVPNPRGLSPLPDRPRQAPSGRRFAFKNAYGHRHRKCGAFLSPSRLSVVYSNGKQTGVDISNAALVIKIGEAVRAIWDRDGSYLELESTRFKDGKRLLAAVDIGAPETWIDSELSARRAAIDRAVSWYPARAGLIFWTAVTVLVALGTVPAHMGGLVLIPGAMFFVSALTYSRRTSRWRLATLVMQHTLPDEHVLHLFKARLVRKGKRPARGFLIATNKRLVFRSGAVVLVDTELSQITSTKQSPLFSVIKLGTEVERYRFEYMVPRSQRRILIRTIRSQPQQPVGPPRWNSEGFPISPGAEAGSAGFSSES